MSAPTRRRTRRVPTVHEVLELGWIVRHTHDMDLALRLLREHLVKAELWDEADTLKWTLDDARQVWRRIVPCLPNSFGAGEGWAFAYGHADEGQRGAFPAVEFWS